MRKRLSIPLLLAAAMLLYAVQGPGPQLITGPERIIDNTPSPESYARNVMVREFSDAGEPLDRTHARELRRFKESAIIEMDEPQRFGHEGNENWVARANTGLLLERTDMLELSGDVSLTYAADGAEFAGEAMKIDLARRTARSTTTVSANQGQNQVRGNIFFADLNREVATLSGGVSSRYVPDDA
ncbi:MAG: LPS export ABC transporter periplasmic protein LptC [Pseudomonadota bacterium]